MTSAEQRIGRESAAEIKAHPFFTGVDWDKIRECEPPFVPQLRSIIDTAYFPTEDLEQVPQGVPPPLNHKHRSQPTWKAAIKKTWHLLDIRIVVLTCLPDAVPSKDL